MHEFVNTKFNRPVIEILKSSSVAYDDDMDHVSGSHPDLPVNELAGGAERTC